MAHFSRSIFQYRKYARASKVTVYLETSSKNPSRKTLSGKGASGQRLALTISDDGVGFDPEQAEFGEGYGISNIKDRVERLGGTLVIHRAPSAGSIIQVQFPLEIQKTATNKKY